MNILRVALIFGKRLDPKGKPIPEFLRQLEKAIYLINSCAADIVVVCGGLTRDGFDTEAEVGKKFLLKYIPEEKIIIETRSLSTRQNVNNVKVLLEAYAKEHNTEITRIIGVSTLPHYERIKYLFRKSWPFMHRRLTFAHVGKGSAKERLKHKIFLMLMKLDPKEIFFMKWRSVWNAQKK